MYRFDSMAHHMAIMVIAEASYILKSVDPAIESTPLGEKPTENILKQLSDLKQALRPLHVPATKIVIDEFAERLSGSSEYPATFFYSAKLFNEILETLRRELKSTKVFVLDSAKARYYESEQPLFGNEVALKFPSLSYEIAEAGNCLAFARGTAAVFHAIRSLEGGIMAMSLCLGIPDPTKGAERNWGAILKKIKTEMETRWPGSVEKFSGEGKTFEGLYGTLAGLQNPYRNATMHFDQIYNVEDAMHVFEMVGGVLRKIASRMDENGMPRA